MPEPFGTITKSKFLKSESHKLHQAFTVDDLKATLTLNADLVTANTVNGSINGVAISQVTFATDHDNTMDLLKEAIEALPSVSSVELTDATTNRQLTVYAKDPSGLFIVGAFTVAAGASQATVTVVTDSNTIYQAMPVKLTTSGKIEPAGAAEAPMNVIGTSIHTAFGGDEATVSMKAHMVIWAKAGTAALNAGPVKLHTTPFDTVSGYVQVDDASVTETNQYGWALDSAVNIGDMVMVAVL